MPEQLAGKSDEIPEGGRKIVRLDGVEIGIFRRTGTLHTYVVHMTNWVINGMPERFPGLRVIWIEGGLAWVPFLMQRLDNEYMMRSSEAPLLRRKPSEYMREMYYTSQPMECAGDLEALEQTFRMIHAETQLLYASDYPHWDFDLPGRIYDLPFLSEDAGRRILGGNARQFFGLREGAQVAAD